MDRETMVLVYNEIRNFNKEQSLTKDGSVSRVCTALIKRLEKLEDIHLDKMSLAMEKEFKDKD